MKVLYIGDFISKNGPSIVDINLFNNLKKIGIKQEQINKKINIKFLKEIYKNKVILISGVSFKGIISMLLGKLLKKNILFIMHGSLKIESNFRKISIKRKLMEYLQLKFCCEIICVSEDFSKKIKGLYPKFSKKIIFINNGINLEKKKKNYLKEKIILILGGGRKEKGVLNVIKAIHEIKKLEFNVIVVGENCKDSEKIKKYKFVKYLNFLEHDNLMLLMEKAEIFIQNSIYESFGIAPLEAAVRNCKIILSKGVNSRILLKEDTYYCIKNNGDIEEIKKNIVTSIIESKLPIFKESRNWEKVAEEYIKEIKKYF